MTTEQKQFVAHIRSTKPTRPEASGYDLRMLNHRDGSSYRDVFDVLKDDKSLGIVIKFPKRRRKGNIMHSLYEVQAVQRMHKDPKLLALKRYAPTILFNEPNTGVIVMPKYKPVRNSEFFEGFLQTFERMLDDLIPERFFEFDGASRNFGINSRSSYVLLDAGLLGEVK